MIRLILQVFCAIFSGFMEATAISNEILPAGSPFLALLCLVPLYPALYSAKKYRESFGILFVQALTVHLISSYWLANFHDFAIFTLGASAVAEAFMAGLCGIVMFLYPSHRTQAKVLEESGGRRQYASFLRALWFAASWTFWEWIKSTGFLAYPWGTISMAAYSWKILTQIASVTGVWGITFIYALFNALLGEGIILLSTTNYAQSKRTMIATWRTEAVFVSVIFGTVALYGAAEYFMPRTPVKALNTIIVQQNIDPWDGGESTSIAISKKLTEQKINELSAQRTRADLVLWSEGVLGHTFPASRFFYTQYPPDESISAFVKRMGVPFIMGGQAMLNQARRRYGNAAVLYDKNGDYAGFYCKMHLVPFAEVIPYADNVLMQKLLNKIVGFSSGWTPGRQYVLFQIPIQSFPTSPTPLEYRNNTYTTIPLSMDGYADPQVTDTFIQNNGVNPDATVSFTTPICFEDAFSDVLGKLHAMGSDVFMNITNDSWSETNSSEYQHFVAASYCAIEYRTTLVRCANAGYSVVVDPAGRIIADLPVFTEAALATSVPIYQHTTTIYEKCGDWFAYLCFIFMAGFALYYFVQLWRTSEGRATRAVQNASSAAEDATVAHAKRPAAKKQTVAKAKLPAAKKQTVAKPKLPAAKKQTVVQRKSPATKKTAKRVQKKTPTQKKALPSERVFKKQNSMKDAKRK